MVKFSQLKKASPDNLDDINRLLAQLSEKAKPLTLHALRQILNDKGTFVISIKDKARIVGMGMIVIIKTFMYTRASLEDVVIHEAYRGKGLGKKLLQKLIQLAKTKKISHIEATSRPDRVVAHHLYETLGFQKRDTNVYSLSLKS